MTREASRAEYDKRMHRVLEQIDRHLDETLELASLAEVAHFSPFHFHRLFSAWMGETLGDYLRRRRLEVAATRLATQPRVPVLNIALSVGFGSPEAFARAFKSRFGVSPSAWRHEDAARRALRRSDAQASSRMTSSNPDQADRKHDQVDRKQDQVDRNPDQAPHRGERQDEGSPHTREPVMQVKIVERQPARVAYLRHIGPYGKSISEFWANAFHPWLATHGLQGRPMYGISHDDPSITAPEKCRYDAGVEVPDDFVATGDANVTTIPGGRYAATRFYGPGSKISEAWDALMRDWLPASGMQLDARPMFEYYPSDMKFDVATGSFECDLMIPVVPL